MPDNLPQGTVTFPGLNTIVGGTMPFTRGISPSVCQIRMVPQDVLNGGIGPLIWSYAGDQIVLNRCAVQTHTLRIDKGREPRMWSIQILDRRWQWRYGEVYGDYNFRMPDNSIKYSTTKHPLRRRNAQQLCDLLLTAMGESGYDVSLIPSDTYPRCQWNGSTPAQQLQTICDMFGFVVVLDYNTDTVKLFPLGVGADLPGGGDLLNPALRVGISQRPDYLLGATGPTRFQNKFKLEAVGRDKDGKWKKIDDLSYAPADDKWTQDWYAAFPNVAKEWRHLAYEDVFRCYRIKEQANGGLDVPGVPEKVVSIDQYVLDDVLVETSKDLDGMPQTRKPFIEGIFWPQCDYAANTTKDKFYNGEFEILKDCNVVRFPYPVLQISTGGTYEPAELYLTTSFFLRKWQTFDLVNYTMRMDLPWEPSGAGPRIIRHPEISAYQIQRYTNTTSLAGRENNRSQVDSELNVYLTYIANTYNAGYQEERRYATLRNIPLDGAIAQTFWSAGNGRIAETRASRNHEADVHTPSYERRRREERTELSLERGNL